MGLDPSQVIAARERLSKIQYAMGEADIEEEYIELKKEANGLSAQLGQTRHERRHRLRHNARQSGAQRRQQRIRGS